jgi:hypothetical protein
MVVNDAINISLNLVSGGDDERLIEGVDQQKYGEKRGDGESSLHSQFRSRHANSKHYLHRLMQTGVDTQNNSVMSVIGMLRQFAATQADRNRPYRSGVTIS